MRGICCRGPSPSLCLIGGTTAYSLSVSIRPRHLNVHSCVYHTTITGPIPPIIKLQKIAGFARAAQCMYWNGVLQKPTGAIVGGNERSEGEEDDCSEVEDA